MFKSIKRIIHRAKQMLVAKLRRLPAIKYWEERARQYGARSVLNLGHTEDEMKTVTAMQKEITFPLLKQELRGNEKLILDLGCGTGRFTADLAAIIHGKAIGIDPIEHLIALAQKDDNVEYKIMIEGVLPVESSSIDIVWICLVLGAIIDDHILLNTILEVKRVLKKDGLVFLVENTEEKKSSNYWKFRHFDDYRSLFDFVKLDHLADYYDLGERISIMAGRRNDIMNRDKPHGEYELLL